MHNIQSATPLGPAENQQTDETRMLIEKSSQMFERVYNQPGNYENREIDTRTKEKPTKRDIENINTAVNEIINQHITSPAGDPFIFLWIANCALYSSVAAFLLLKGWKKAAANDRPRRNVTDKKKKEYQDKATELRKKISIAKAELERLREN